MIATQEAKNINLEKANTSSGDIFKEITGFLSRYWALLAIAGAAFVGILLLLKLVFQF